MTQPVPPPPPIDIHPDHWAIVHGILQKHVPQHAVWAFGSRATGKAKPFSDLDLAIITDAALPPDVSASLRDDFSESDLPWKVDVIDWATTSAAFRAIVERERVVVQEGAGSLNMPIEWKTYSLADIYKFSSGLSKPRAEFGSGYPFLSFKDVFYNSAAPTQLTELVQSTEQERAKFSIICGDVFLTRTSETMDELGMSCVALADIPHATFNGFTKRLRPKQKLVVVPGFARYFFRSSEFRSALNAMSTMSTRASLNNEMLERLTITLPAYTEQEAIAHILGTLDDKIELLRKQNETLEAMARALFKAWFVDFEPVRAKLEGRWQPGQSLPGLPAHFYNLFPDRLVESELGEIPEGWERVFASHLVDFNPGEPLRKGADAPYIEMSSLPTTGSWPEPPVSRPFGSGMRFRNGDTLFARITPCLENGKTAFVQCLPDNTVGWGSTEYIVMRAKAPVPSEFGYLLARSDAFREQAIRSMTGTSGRQRVQADSVAAFRLASPPSDEVWNAFSKVVEPQFRSIKANAKTIDTLAQLRDTLLPKLISGELRVPNAESIAEDGS